MKIISMEEEDCPIIKTEQPDSSERDSPDNGIDIKEELLETHNDHNQEEEEEEESLSPTASMEEEEQQKVNRRKRKVPMKYSNGDSNGSQNPMTSMLPTEAKRMLDNKAKFSVMTEERARNQAINSVPRSSCPICGDKANGLHYGIYTCEACKNFFKRSVAIDVVKTYICKYNNACNVNITEVDGVKMKGPRCQACRYQACLDAGMYHSGVQRTRGGRHGYSPVKQRSNSVEQRYPTIQPPNISAVMAAAVAASNNNSTTSSTAMNEDLNQSFEPADVVSVSMSPPSSEHNDQSLYDLDQFNFLQKNQLWEQFVADNVRNEVELLKSRTTIAETLLAEKSKQLDVVQRQVSMLKQHLLQADQLNKEQAITIESLKRRLSNGGTSHHLRNGQATLERVSDYDKVRLFENGGVTITPVNASTTSSVTTSSTNLLSSLLTSTKCDMATIEPIRHEGSRNKS